MTTTTAFDTEALRRGLEERDAASLAGLFAEDATFVSIDRRTQPSAPLTITGRAAIADHLIEVCARDMTHVLDRVVADQRHAAFVELCHYPDGTQVVCSAMADLASDGRIARQITVTAWDE